MPFALVKYKSTINKKIQLFLIQDLNIKQKIAQKLLSKHRVFDSDKNIINTNDSIKTEHIYIAEFVGVSRGLKPLLSFKDFAIFDKPSKLIVHPISKNTPYSLLDEIRSQFGKDANLIHRIDAETSGLVIVGKNKKSEKELKVMFEEKKYHKSYLALVNGKVDKKVNIEESLEKEGKNIGVRMTTSKNGKSSQTIINPILYNQEKDISLVQAIPLTGRQHQIRVHLHSIGHTILGDPIYGIDDFWAEEYLNKNLSEKKRVEVTKSYRLWLHANYLEFEYKQNIYKIFSKNREIYEEFYK